MLQKRKNNSNKNNKNNKNNNKGINRATSPKITICDKYSGWYVQTLSFLIFVIFPLHLMICMSRADRAVVNGVTSLCSWKMNIVWRRKKLRKIVEFSCSTYINYWQIGQLDVLVFVIIDNTRIVERWFAIGASFASIRACLTTGR